VTLPLERDAEPAHLDAVHTCNDPRTAQRRQGPAPAGSSGAFLNFAFPPFAIATCLFALKWV
jgi:hypothetical protein